MNPTLIVGIASAALPTLAVLVGILINRTDAGRLSGDIWALRAEMRGRLDSLDSKIDATRLQLQNDMRGLDAKI